MFRQISHASSQHFMEHSIRLLLLQPKLLMAIRNEQFRQHINFISLTLTALFVTAIIFTNLLFQPPQVAGELRAAVAVLEQVVGISRIGQTLKDP